MEPLMRVARNLVLREAEIKAKERADRQYVPADYCSVREYVTERGLLLTPGQQARFTQRANAYYQQHQIQRPWVERPTAYQRVDRSFSTRGVHVFPRSVLEVCEPSE
jgi:hypothetical protein